MQTLLVTGLLIFMGVGGILGIMAAVAMTKAPYRDR